MTNSDESLPTRGFESTDKPIRLAKVLRVVRHGPRPAELYIDGELFGYATVDGFTAGPTAKSTLPSVALRIVGHRVEFVDDLDREAERQMVDG